MKLAELQERFFALVTRPEAATPEELARVVRGTSEFPSSERVQVYSNMYLWREVDALRLDFPALVALLGDEAFFGLASAYIARHPSEHPSLARLGRRMESFLREASPRGGDGGDGGHRGGDGGDGGDCGDGGAAGDSPATARADLADLAALEWARCEVFSAEGPTPLAAEALAEVAPEVLPSARLALTPALRRLVLEHAVAGLWRALVDGAGGAGADTCCGTAHAVAAPAVAPGPQTLAVWRQGDAIYHASVEPMEAEALGRALAGAPIAVVCDAFAAAEAPAEAAFAALGSWFADGWIVGVVTP